MSNSHPYDMGHSSVLLLIIYNLLLQQGPTFAQYVLCNLTGDTLPLGGCRPVCPFKWTLELCSSDRAWSTMLISQKRLPGGHRRESLRLRAPTASSLLTIKPVGTSGWGIKHTLSLSTPLLSLQPILCPIAPRGPTILVSHSPAQNPPMILHWPRPRSQLLSLEPLPSRSGSQPHLQPCLIFLLACWTPAPCSPEPCPIFPFLGLCPGCS